MEGYKQPWIKKTCGCSVSWMAVRSPYTLEGLLVFGGNSSGLCKVTGITRFSFVLWPAWVPDNVISWSLGPARGSEAGCHEYGDGPWGSVKGAEGTERQSSYQNGLYFIYWLSQWGFKKVGCAGTHHVMTFAQTDGECLLGAKILPFGRTHPHSLTKGDICIWTLPLHAEYVSKIRTLHVSLVSKMKFEAREVWLSCNG